MEVANPSVSGSLQISTDVIAKIARLATLDGVNAVSLGAAGVKGLLPKARGRRPIEVMLSDDVAEITVYVQVKYGSKVPQLGSRVQESVKNAVQNMTGITVSKVNIVITGVAVPSADAVQEE